MHKTTFFRFAPPVVLGCGFLVLAGCGGGGSGNGNNTPSPTVAPTSSPTPAPTAGPNDPRDFTSDIQGLVISSNTSSEFAGALLAGKGGAGINWYFTNLALLPFVTSANKTLVRNYLDVFLAHVSASTGKIDDFSNISPRMSITSDSDDAYISTLLSLACRYRRITGDNDWWMANKAKLKTISQLILLNQQNGSGPSSGLIKTQIPGKTQAQLIDNCENYGGLNDFAAELKKDGDADASRYANSATRVANGIKGLFNGKSFATADIEGDKTFYPERVAQVYPQLYDVPLGASTQAIYDSAWNYMNAGGINWATTKDDGSNKDDKRDGFPFMVLGAVAAKRGQKGTAQAQLKYYLQNQNDSKFSNIQEIGFAQQLQIYLK